MIKSFRDLRVWQKARQLTLTVYRKTQNFPTQEQFGLTSQIRRSATSICANIAEGGKKSRKDFLRFLEIADGSLEETKSHLILSRDLGYLTTGNFEELMGVANEIGRMLNALMESLRNS